MMHSPEGKLSLDGRLNLLDQWLTGEKRKKLAGPPSW